MSTDKEILDNIDTVEMRKNFYDTVRFCVHADKNFCGRIRYITDTNTQYQICQSCISIIEPRIIFKGMFELTRLMSLVLNKIDKMDLERSMTDLLEKKD